MQEHQPYSQLIHILTDLVDKRRSGTLFIHSDCNHAITFALDQGRIYAIFHGARRGRKAIPYISKVSGGTYKFENSELGGVLHELPPTPEILHLLRTGTGPVTAPKTVNSGDTPSTAISEDMKNQLCQALKGLLAEHLGPIAEIVFEDATDEVGDFCSSPELAHNLIDKLSLDIDDSDEVTQFKTQAYSLINSLFKT